jgi:hypothetical protein
VRDSGPARSFLKREINSTVLQPRMFSESPVVATIDPNQFTGPALARLGHTPAAGACAEPPKSLQGRFQ